MRALLLAGADKVGINTAAVADPELVRRASDAFGNQAIVVAVDARREPAAPGEPPRWEVFTHGGRQADRPRRGRLVRADGARRARARSC